MVAPCLLLCFLNVALKMSGCEGIHHGDEGRVGRHPLEGPIMDVLEKIKLATGYPIDRNPLSKIHRPLKIYRKSSQRPGNVLSEKGNSVSGEEEWDEFAVDGYRDEDGNPEAEFGNGRNRDRAFLVKGYEYVHRRDETRGYDSFWDNSQTEGKWFEQGRKKMKNEGEECIKGEKMESRKPGEEETAKERKVNRKASNARELKSEKLM